VLNYAIEAFYLSEAFDESQQSGLIPDYEPYDIGSFITTDDSGLTTFNTLDATVRIALLKHYEANRIPHFAPDQYVISAPGGLIQAYAFLPVAPDRFLIGFAQVRDFRFRGISASELADQLSTIEIGEGVDSWLKGDPVAVNADSTAKTMVEVQNAIDSGGFLSGSFGGGFELPVSIRLNRL